MNVSTVLQSLGVGAIAYAIVNNFATAGRAAHQSLPSPNVCTGDDNQIIPVYREIALRDEWVHGDSPSEPWFAHFWKFNVHTLLLIFVILILIGLVDWLYSNERSAREHERDLE